MPTTKPLSEHELMLLNSLLTVDFTHCQWLVYPTSGIRDFSVHSSLGAAKSRQLHFKTIHGGAEIHRWVSRGCWVKIDDEVIW
jgi:hypothetical protein